MGHDEASSNAPAATSRRRFLAGAAGLTGAALASRFVAPGASADAATRSGSTGSTLGLTLGRQTEGFLHSVVGGDPTADVVTEIGTNPYAPSKHIANTHFEDIIVEADLSLGQPFYNLISDTFAGVVPATDGSVVLADGDLNVRSSLNFTGALFRAVTFPALDASSTDAAFLTATLAPRTTSVTHPGGKLKTSRFGKRWLAANFRMTLDGVDLSRVSRIESFTITQTLEEGRGPNDYISTGLTFPDLVITMPESKAASLAAWFDSFVVQGNNDDTAEKSGKIEFLAGDLKTVLASVRLLSVGIAKLDHRKTRAGEDGARKVTAELYCERMQFVYGNPPT